jgi:hypothetical protein
VYSRSTPGCRHKFLATDSLRNRDKPGFIDDGDNGNENLGSRQTFEAVEVRGVALVKHPVR